MTDIIVTIPKDRWPDFARSHRDGGDASHTLYGARPPLLAGDYLYFLARGRVRCAIDVSGIEPHRGGFLVRGIFRAAWTTDDFIKGFRGWQPAPFARDRVRADRAWQHFSPPPSFSHLPAAPLAHGKTSSEQGGSSA